MSFTETPTPLSEDACAVLRRNTPLLITKATTQSTVHRPVFMDHVGVKRFDDNGTVIGEMRFIGLYSSSAYRASLVQIPLIEGKVRQVFQRSDRAPDTHRGRTLLHVLENMPRKLQAILLDTLEDKSSRLNGAPICLPSHLLFFYQCIDGMCPLRSIEGLYSK